MRLGRGPSATNVGSVEQIPKLTPDQLQEWNTVIVCQKPNYVTPRNKKQEKQKKKEVAASSSKGTTDPVPEAPTSLQPRPPSLLLPEVGPEVLEPRMSAGPTVVDDFEEAFGVGTPASSADGPPSSAVGLESDLVEDTLNIMRCDPPAEHRSCPLCSNGQLTLHRLREQQLLIWMCHSEETEPVNTRGKERFPTSRLPQPSE